MRNRSIPEIDATMAQVASDLEDLREKRAVLVFQYEQKELVLRQRMNKLDQRWIKRRSDRKPHEYTEAMEKVQGKQKLIPSRVIRQQADLCRSFHQLEVLEQDVDHIKDRHRETIRLLHQQIKEIHDQKDELELTYMNKLCTAEGELNEIRDQYSKFMVKQNLAWVEKEESMSFTVNTLDSLDEEDSCEEDFEPVDRSTTIMGGIRTLMWGSSSRKGNNTAAVSTPAPAPAKTPEKRRRACSKAFTPPPPRNNPRVIKTSDRQHMVEVLMSS
jgi:phage shock protein A